MSTSNNPVFAYSRPGLKFEVFENRIEVGERGGLLGLGGKSTTILLRNVASVEVEGFRKELTIRTTDDKRHKYQLAAEGEKARDAIVSLL